MNDREISETEEMLWEEDITLRRRRDLQDRLLRLKAKWETLKGSRAKLSAEIGRDLERRSQLRGKRGWSA